MKFFGCSDYSLGCIRMCSHSARERHQGASWVRSGPWCQNGKARAHGQLWAILAWPKLRQAAGIILYSLRLTVTRSGFERLYDWLYASRSAPWLPPSCPCAGQAFRYKNIANGSASPHQDTELSPVLVFIPAMPSQHVERAGIHQFRQPYRRPFA